MDEIPYWFCLRCNSRLANVRQSLMLSIDNSYSNQDLYGARWDILSIQMYLESMNGNVQLDHAQCSGLELLDIGMTGKCQYRVNR